MDKKSTRILLSILHICILGVCILTIYSNRHSGTTVAHVSFDTETAVTPKETVKGIETETDAAKEAEPADEEKGDAEPGEEAETETAPEAGTPAEAAGEAEEAEDAGTPAETVQYSFRFTGKRNKLNIRNAPSMDAEIVAKVPVGGGGSVLELTDENWVQIEYDGTVGYCSRSWIELQEITE